MPHPTEEWTGLLCWNVRIYTYILGKENSKEIDEKSSTGTAFFLLLTYNISQYLYIYMYIVYIYIYLYLYEGINAGNYLVTYFIYMQICLTV